MITDYGIDYYKDTHHFLYSRVIGISGAFEIENYCSIEKKNLKKEIKKFLNDLSNYSSKIEYVEDYIWISDTVTFWETYLESIFDDFSFVEFHESDILISRDKDPIFPETLEKITKRLHLEKPSLILVTQLFNYQIKILAEQIEMKYKKIIEIQNLPKKIIVSSWEDYSKSEKVIINLKQECKKYLEKNIGNPIIFLYDYASERYRESELEEIEEKPETRLILGETIHELLREFEEYFWLRDISIVYFISNKNAEDWILKNIQSEKWYTISRQLQLDLSNSNNFKETNLQKTNNSNKKPDKELALGLNKIRKNNMRRNAH